MRIRSFVAWVADATDRDDASNDRAAPDDPWQSWRRGSLRMRYVLRAGETRVDADQSLSLMLGDPAGWDAQSPDEVLGAGTPVRYDEARQELVILTSIVGLPPVVLYRAGNTIAVTSDLHLLDDVPGVRLELDAIGVSELGRFGHPVGHRTLLRHVNIVPSGSGLSLSAGGGAVVRRVWQLPDTPRLAWTDFVEVQIDAFARAQRSIDVSASFLSLTAGLDTRTVFAQLAREQRLIPAATMTGTRLSLDARIAQRLCRSYGVPHTAVTFDDRFLRELPRFVQAASRLSGGISSLDQAPEVYMYDQLGDTYGARLSGNLGNQVGRGGTEGVSIRGADLEILAPRLRDTAASGGHWLLEQLHGSDRTRTEFIIQCEVPFTLVGNYGIGNHHAVQQTPYASRQLIETLAVRPTTAVGTPTGSEWRMRLRDLRHRFLGEAEAHSFQRTLVHRAGGFAAHCPVNWGWRPDGSVSPGGLAVGAATFAGMFARATGLDEGILRRPLAISGLPALHDFRESRRWLRVHLRDFTFDTLRDPSLRGADLFDATVLDRYLDEHFSGRQDHYQTITFALDVGLAHRELCA